MTHLVLHVLAHLPVDGAESLWNPAYITWIRDLLPPRPWAEEDARLVPARWTPQAASLVLLAEHHSVADLLADEDDRGLDPVLVGLVRTTLALEAPAFSAVFAGIPPDLGDVDAALDHAVEVVPGLAERRIEGVISLGARGRALHSRILVGVPGPWTDIDPWIPAVVAAHEHLVLQAEGDWCDVELAALTGLAGIGGRLGRAHERWIEALDLGELARLGVARGRLTPAEGAALRGRGGRRGALRRVGRR